MTEYLPHLPPLPGERGWNIGTLDKCEECKHKWHGLPCVAPQCSCPTAYTGPTE